MEDMNKQDFEKALSQLWENEPETNEEQEHNDEKKISHAIAVRKALEFLFERKDLNLADKISILSIPEIKEIARMRTVDKLLVDIYGEPIYEKYFVDYMNLKISHKGTGRTNMLDFVKSMKEAEEKESMLREMGLISRIRNHL